MGGSRPPGDIFNKKINESSASRRETAIKRKKKNSKFVSLLLTFLPIFT